jgi:Arc/MetJ-type ribon-helix-helix transcriptional regulator
MDVDVKLTFRARANESSVGRAALRAAQERWARAIEEITRSLEPADVVRALSAADDAEFIVRVITASGALGRAFNSPTDPILAARLRGAYIRDATLAGPEMETAEQIAGALGVKRQTVDNWRKTQKLLGLERGRRGYLYPCWQVVDHKVLPGLSRVLIALGADDPWRAHRFLTSPEPRLGDRTPIEALRQADVDSVVAAAQLFGGPGAA